MIHITVNVSDPSLEDASLIYGVTVDFRSIDLDDPIKGQPLDLSVEWMDNYFYLHLEVLDTYQEDSIQGG